MKEYQQFSIEKYIQNEKGLNGFSANMFSLVFAGIIFAVLGFIYYRIWGYFIQQPSLNNINVLFLLVAAGFLFVHEIIHAIVWSKHTDVKFDFIFKSLFRLCYCENAIKMKKYIIGLIIPSIILGIIPAVAGMVLGNKAIFLFGLIMIAAGGDDFFAVYVLRKANKESWIKDMKSRIGFIVYEPIP